MNYSNKVLNHFDQNNSYEITINEIRNAIFGLRFGKPSSAFRGASRMRAGQGIWILRHFRSF